MSKTKTLIDAEAWLEQVSDSWMYKNTARRIIAEAPRVEVPCWVSVDEELPTEPDEYIVMIAGAEKPTVLHFDVDDEKNGVWFEEVEDQKEFSVFAKQIDGGAVEETPVTRQGRVYRIFYKVTYWMPMPEKPGKEIRTVEDACPYKEGKKPNVCKCRSCGAEIVFVMMQSGAKMPCDAALIRCREDKSAKTSFVTPNGIVMRGVETPDGVADFWGYRSHFESCPQAEEFRRRK